MNIVQAEHIGDIYRKAYTYKLPDGVRIEAGKYILVENKQTRSNDIVKTITDSEDVNENVLKMIMGEQEVRSKVLGEYVLVPLKGGMTY